MKATKVAQAARDSVLSLQHAHRAEVHRARVVCLALSAVTPNTPANDGNGNATSCSPDDASLNSPNKRAMTT